MLNPNDFMDMPSHYTEDYTYYRSGETGHSLGTRRIMCLSSLGTRGKESGVLVNLAVGPKVRRIPCRQVAPNYQNQRTSQYFTKWE